MKMLIDLDFRECRFPVSSDAETSQTLFCAATTEIDRVYCAKHYNIAIQPQTQNRRAISIEWRRIAGRRL